MFCCLGSWFLWVEEFCYVRGVVVEGFVGCGCGVVWIGVLGCFVVVFEGYGLYGVGFVLVFLGVGWLLNLGLYFCFYGCFFWRWVVYVECGRCY